MRITAPMTEVRPGNGTSAYDQLVVAAHKPRPSAEKKSLTNSRLYLVAVLVAVAGLALLYAGGRDDWFRSRPGLQILISQVGSVLLAAVALSLLWEWFGKRSFADEILEKVGIGSDVDRAGLTRITDQYLKDVEWERYLQGAEKLDIVVAYARTWRRTHWAQLQDVAKSSKARIRIILPDPAHHATLVVLADRFSRTPPDLKTDIDEAIADFCSLTTDGGAQVELYLHKGDYVFSCYRMDSVAVISMYSHSRKRRSVPTIVCRSGGSLFDFVYDEITDMIESATEMPCADLIAKDPEPAAAEVTDENS